MSLRNIINKSTSWKNDKILSKLITSLNNSINCTNCNTSDISDNIYNISKYIFGNLDISKNKFTKFSNDIHSHITYDSTSNVTLPHNLIINIGFLINTLLTGDTLDPTTIQTFIITARQLSIYCYYLFGSTTQHYNNVLFEFVLTFNNMIQNGGVDSISIDSDRLVDYVIPLAILIIDSESPEMVPISLPVDVPDIVDGYIQSLSDSEPFIPDTLDSFGNLISSKSTILVSIQDEIDETRTVPSIRRVDTFINIKCLIIWMFILFSGILFVETLPNLQSLNCISIINYGNELKLLKWLIRQPRPINECCPVI